MAEARRRPWDGPSAGILPGVCPKCGSGSEIETASEAALALLFAFAASISEETQDSTDIEQERARHRLALALAEVSTKPCRNLGDARQLHKVYKKLRDWFPKDDPRVFSLAVKFTDEVPSLLNEAISQSHKGGEVRLHEWMWDE
jgi:hypothetical protein